MTTKAAILQAIRRKCLDCSCFQPSEVRECPVTRCELWPYRFGHDPDPSRTRGFAKPAVYTRGLPPIAVGVAPDPTPTRRLAKSTVHTGDSEDSETVRPDPVPADA